MRGQRIITVLRGNTYNMPLVISLYSNFKWATSLSVIFQHQKFNSNSNTFTYLTDRFATGYKIGILFAINNN